MTMQGSASSSWTLLIARALSKRGVDATKLFRRAHTRPERLHDPNARYPLAAMQRLWRLTATATRDPCFGLEVGRMWHPTSFHALGYSALAAPSLRDALKYVARYSAVVSTGASVEVIEGPEVTLTLRSRVPSHESNAEWTAAAMQAAIASIVIMCRQVGGGAVHLQRVTFRQSGAGRKSRLEAFFGCPVLFKAKYDSVVFRAADLDTPLATANPQLVSVNEQALIHHVARLSESAISARARSELVRRLPSGECNQTVVAKALHMSLRSLQRKLRHEATSFRKLLEETRRNLARQYLQDSTLTRSEIAFLLGFKEPNSLSRGLRRWKLGKPRSEPVHGIQSRTRMASR